MFYFDKQMVGNSAALKSQWDEVAMRRDTFRRHNDFLATLTGNAAAHIPADAYRDVDAQTKKIMAGEEGNTILNALLPLAKALPIGKIVAEYRRSSDSGNAQSSISGQGAKLLDKATYDYDGTLVLIHDDSFGREWREVEAMRSEGFDGIMDDQANSVRAVRRQFVTHMVDGISSVKYKGYQALGIKGQAAAFDLGSGGQNIDLTSASATYADIRQCVVSMLKAINSTNNAEGDVDFFVSDAIWYNFMRQDGTGAFAKTFMQLLLEIPGVKSIQRTQKLTGNQVIAGVLSTEYIQPIVGMAVNTTPMIRQTPFSNYNFLTWGACGILVKADAAGRKGWLYASAA